MDLNNHLPWSPGPLYHFLTDRQMAICCQDSADFDQFLKSLLFRVAYLASEVTSQLSGCANGSRTWPRIVFLARDLHDGLYAVHFLLILNYSVLEEHIDVSMNVRATTDQ